MDDVKDVVKGFLQFLFEEKKASVGLRMSIDNMGMDYGMNFVHAPPLKWAGVHVCLIYAEQKLYLAIQNVPNFNSWSMEKIQSIFFSNVLLGTSMIKVKRYLIRPRVTNIWKGSITIFARQSTSN